MRRKMTPILFTAATCFGSLFATSCTSILEATECTHRSDCEGIAPICRFGECFTGDIDAVGGGDAGETDVASSDTDSGGASTTSSIFDVSPSVDDDYGAPTTTVTLKAQKDTEVRADHYLRRNDNYGCDPSLVVARGRALDYEFPAGAPGATEVFLQFDLSSLSRRQVVSAQLELTVMYLERKTPIDDMPLHLHRIIPSDDRTPWSEGNGTENALLPYGCDTIDRAYGVAWKAATTDTTDKPDLGDKVYDEVVVSANDMLTGGDTVVFDVTELVNEWITGAFENHGLAIVAADWGASFHSIAFMSMEAERNTFIDNAGKDMPGRNGPRLHLEMREQH